MKPPVVVYSASENFKMLDEELAQLNSNNKINS